MIHVLKIKIKIKINQEVAGSHKKATIFN